MTRADGAILLVVRSAPGTGFDMAENPRADGEFEAKEGSMVQVMQEIDGAIVARDETLLRVPVPVRTRWEYDLDDPLAVKVLLAGRRSEWVEWVFSRDLLADGLIAAAGVGDVQIMPMDHVWVRMELRSPSGYAAIHFNAEHVCEFLQESYDQIRPGAEPIAQGLDSWIGQISI
ncbi:SsgA family sporulation/cell division regulator [Pseudonocardiaceae bacterium YIM PH 21723]|nr:SsgA family sporulation/cell division regulator [Pseudonocardiaceae bacterium YIM PH 21723]